MRTRSLQEDFEDAKDRGDLPAQKAALMAVTMLFEKNPEKQSGFIVGTIMGMDQRTVDKTGEFLTNGMSLEDYEGEKDEVLRAVKKLAEECSDGGEPMVIRISEKPKPKPERRGIDKSVDPDFHIELCQGVYQT